MTDFRTFRRFVDHQQALDLVRWLNDHGLTNNLVESASSLDSNYGGGQQTRLFEVQLLGADFEKATALMEKGAKDSIAQIDEDHYLFEFTNEELYEILLKPDEWSVLDNQLANHILNERGENVNQDLINSLKRQRMKDLEKPEPSQKTWIYAGYILSLLGGFFGIFIGWHIWRSTKILPDGRKVHSYNASDREHGIFIFITGLIVFPISFLWRLKYGV